jgi:hypothetical protein
MAMTARNERYLVAYADVRAVRLTAKGAGAGY